MRNLLLFLLIAFSIECSGQLVKRQFTTLSGTKQWGYIYVPADKTKKYPVVIFCHGSGENGGTETSVTSLLKYGPQTFVNNGWKPDYIIIAIQHHTWSFPADRIVYVLNNDPDVKAYGNGKALITGLSAGGEIVLNFMRQYHDPNKYSYVIMSPSGTGSGLTKPPYKSWGFVGNNDLTTRGALATLYNMQSAIGTKVTVFPGGHCCWNTFYDPAYKEDGKNMYQYSLGDTTTTPPPVVVIPPPVIPTKTVVTKVEITFFSDSTFETKKISSN